MLSLPRQDLQPCRPSGESAPAGLTPWVVGPRGVQPDVSPLSGVGRVCGQQAGCLALQLIHPLPVTNQGLAEERQRLQGAHNHGAWVEAGLFLVISMTL